MAAVAGLRGTGDWATDERPKNFREFIQFRNPNGTAPIFGLMSRAQKESVDDPEFSWWDEPNDIIHLLVNGAVGANVTTIVVDSADPSDTAPDNRWGLATHLVSGDLLLADPTGNVDIAQLTATNHEIMEVDTIISGTTFTVKRGAAGTTPIAIANNDKLTKIGSTFEEGTAAPRAATRNPIKYHNFTQIFKTTYELTNTAKATNTRTGDPVRNDKKRRAFDHARDIEMALIHGIRNETAAGPEGKPIRQMGGIRYYLPSARSKLMAPSDTMNDFLDNVFEVFDFDTPAGDSRIAFCGNLALNALNKEILGSSSTNINWGGVIGQFGMNFREFIMPQGRLLLRTHPLLNRHTMYSNSILILDFSAIRWRPLRGRDTKMMDNIQSKDEDLTRGQWLTEAGIEVKYGGLTMAYIGGVDLILT